MLNFFFSFNGRIRRTHYFLGALLTGLVKGAFYARSFAFGHYWDGDWPSRYSYSSHWVGWPMMPGFWAVGAVIGLACFWAQFALAAKRWHDAGTSGWLSLLMLVPGVDFIVFIILCLLPPTQGPNQYGSDPRMTTAPA